MNTSGIFYIPTKSFDEVTNPHSGQFEGILQQHFTFDHENSADEAGSIPNYLEIPLNQLREENSSHLDKRYNTIIVEGYAILTPNSLGQNNSYFRHIWVTDWNISDNFEANLRFDSFENNTNDNVSNTYDPPGSSFINAFGTECVFAPPQDVWFNLNDEVVGWSKKSGGTTSSSTGPNGGCDPNGNPINSPASNLHYIYTETSDPFNDGDHVMIVRSRANNFTNLMNDTSNNLNLVYNVHRFGSGMNFTDGILRVYIDTNAQSNSAIATLLDTVVGQQQSSNNQPYLTRIINLNAYREVDDTHYIYFVFQHNSTSFRADCAIDNIKIVETINGLNEGSSFTQTTTGGGSGVIAFAPPALVINETTQTPVIRFRVHTNKKLYIKGSYLLM